MSRDQDSPDWFAAAIAREPRLSDITVDGARLRLRAWGDPGDPGLVLVHGGAAHAGWWDHIAPLLAVGRHVVALDLSGHGDSEHRSSYGLPTWASEVVAAAEVAGGGHPVTVVGHSMGGRISAVAASRSPEVVAALAVFDSPLMDTQPDEATLVERRKPSRVYPSLEAAMARFVTLPPQDVVLPYVREHVARSSLREVEGGWTWKFDRSMYGNATEISSLLRQLACPMTLFRSEHGIVPEDTGPWLRSLLGEHVKIVEMAATGHHPMLDQPLAVVAALRTQLAAWAALPTVVAP